MESFGTRLRRYRSERQWSLSDLSARTHYSPGHLSKVENDLRTPTRELAASCDAALGARGALLAAQGADRTVDATGGEGRPAEPAHAAASPDEAALPALPATLSDGAATPVVAALTTVLDGLRATAQSAGPGAVLESAAAQVRALRGMAANARAPEAEPLLSLAGRYAEFIAWMCQEADDERSALGWARTTASFARHVGSPDIEANALMRRSLLALYCDDGAATVELASAAAGFTASSATRIRALLRLAQGHAQRRRPPLPPGARRRVQPALRPGRGVGRAAVARLAPRSGRTSGSRPWGPRFHVRQRPLRHPSRRRSHCHGQRLVPPGARPP
ncbi:helix-turn-helix domain-containing protein [Streptomyces microflavus]|uniref:helix-turn-helix domain-containing protein n=1 Tax=Streptomyces microflavus TaxID=1919 RepID=UPI003696AE7F